MSLYQAVTNKKIPFGRTPKVKERTCAPKHYILLELTLLFYCLFAFLLDLEMANFVRALYSAVNAVVFFAIFAWFIGWKESKEDIFGPGVLSHREAGSAMRVRSLRKRMLVSKALVPLLAGVVFLTITLVTVPPLIAS